LLRRSPRPRRWRPPARPSPSPGAPVPPTPAAAAAAATAALRVRAPSFPTRATATRPDSSAGTAITELRRRPRAAHASPAPTGPTPGAGPTPDATTAVGDQARTVPAPPSPRNFAGAGPVRTHPPDRPGFPRPRTLRPPPLLPQLPLTGLVGEPGVHGELHGVDLRRLRDLEDDPAQPLGTGLELQAGGHRGPGRDVPEGRVELLALAVGDLRP